MPSHSEKLEWRFNINPVAASRPRVGRWGAYYSGPYKLFREQAAEVVWEVLGSNFTPLSSQLAVTLEVYVQQPKSTELDAPRPDIDNYIKSVLDLMNGKLWDDDTQIISLYATKQWASKGEQGYFILGVNSAN